MSTINIGNNISIKSKIKKLEEEQRKQQEAYEKEIVRLEKEAEASNINENQASLTVDNLKIRVSELESENLHLIDKNKNLQLIIEEDNKKNQENANYIAKLENKLYKIGEKSIKNGKLSLNKRDWLDFSRYTIYALAGGLTGSGALDLFFQFIEKGDYSIENVGQTLLGIGGLLIAWIQTHRKNARKIKEEESND